MGLDTETPEDTAVERALEKLDIDRPDIDTSPVTPRELRGWYIYGFASEGFAGVSTAVMIPLILESMASISGYDATDKTYSTPCDVSKAGYSCVIFVGSLKVDTSSFVYYCTTISVILQLFTFISISSLADHGNYRKRFMLILGYGGAILGLCFLALVKTSLWGVGALLYIFANLLYCASYVFFYAYVPILSRNHPEVIAVRESGDKLELSKTSDRLTNSISAKGFAWGYLASTIELLLSLVIAFIFPYHLKAGTGNRETVEGLPPTYRLTLGVALSCVWWLAFMSFTIKWTKPRPGPPFPAGANFLTYSWKTLGRTISKAARLSNLFKFLIVWFIYSDTFGTIASSATLFARNELGATDTELLLVATLVPFCAGIGSIITTYFQRFTKLSTRNIIILQIGLYAILPAYGLLGFVAPIGIRQHWEIWLVGAWHGLLLGSTQSYCRSLFSELLPAGKEAEFFGLYEITDKGSSWIGSLVVGAIQDSGPRRNIFWFLFAAFVLPLVLIFFVDVEKGRKQAHDFNEEEFSIEEKK